MLDKFVAFAKIKKNNGFKCNANDHLEDDVIMRERIGEMYYRKNKESSDDRRQLSKAIVEFTVTAEKLAGLIEKG